MTEISIVTVSLELPCDVWTTTGRNSLGAAFVVVALIVALIFWMKRSEVPGCREENRSAA